MGTIDHSKKVLANIADYQTVFNTIEGKRVLRSLMKKTGFMQTNFVEKDPYATAFNEGSRNVVLHILSQLKVDVKQMEKLLTEGHDDADTF